MKIAFGGDFAPLNEFSSFNYNSVMINGQFPKVDFFFLNLETVLSFKNLVPNNNVNGYVQQGNPKCLPLARKLGVDAFNLANNHILDFGKLGFEETKKHLKKHHIRFFGCSKNKQEASKPFICKKNNKVIAILSIFQDKIIEEKTTFISSPNIYEITTKINNLKKRSDHIVLWFHGGEEWMPFPSTEKQALFRYLIDIGVSVIISNHSHLCQGYESYKKGLIFYGLGNFWLPKLNWSKNKINQNIGIVPIITFNKKSINFEIFINEICDNGDLNLIRYNSKNYQIKLLFDLLNEPLFNKKLLMGIWQEISIKRYRKEFSNILGWNINNTMYPLKEFIKVILYKYFKKRFYSRVMRRFKRRYIFVKNTGERELLESALGLLSHSVPDYRNKKTAKIVSKLLPWV